MIPEHININRLIRYGNAVRFSAALDKEAYCLGLVKMKPSDDNASFVAQALYERFESFIWSYHKAHPAGE